MCKNGTPVQMVTTHCLCFDMLGSLNNTVSGSPHVYHVDPSHNLLFFEPC